MDSSMYVPALYAGIAIEIIGIAGLFRMWFLYCISVILKAVKEII